LLVEIIASVLAQRFKQIGFRQLHMAMGLALIH
jgi:hypothetical protein